MRTKRDIIFPIAAIVLGMAPIVVLAVMLFMPTSSADIGIIGGADGPTSVYLTKRLITELLLYNYVLKFCVSFALPVILSGAFYLIFTKLVKQNCTLKTSATALGISASLGLGLYCFFIWALTAAFGDLRQHPISFSAAKIFGVLSFAAFVGLSILYVFLRKKKMSVKGIIIEFLLTVIYAIPFLIGFSCIHGILSDVIAKFQ